MKTLIYQVRCLTNMHVGSGDTAYNIIDNEIEKDPVLNNTAVINPSGVKGAVKAYFSAGVKDGQMLNYIFGNETGTDRDIEMGRKKTVPGNYKFMGATLMARPFRVSDGNVSYVLTTTAEIINYQLNLFKMLGVDEIAGSSLSGLYMPETAGGIMICGTEINGVEGRKVRPFENRGLEKLLKKLIGPRFAVVDRETWEEQDYPVIARNHLNDQGISENLWYEEIIPHESIFYFAVLAEEDYQEEFKNKMESIIQFGANASVGCGYAKVHCIAESGENGNE